MLPAPETNHFDPQPPASVTRPPLKLTFVVPPFKVSIQPNFVLLPFSRLIVTVWPLFVIAQPMLTPSF